MDPELLYITRREMSYVEQLIDEINQNGIVCNIVAPGGTGKTTFLQKLKQDLEERDSNVVCIYEGIRPVDSPPDFFYGLINEIQSVTHPTKQKIKEFFGKKQKYMQAGSQIAGFIPGAPPGISGAANEAISLLTPTKLTGQTEVYKELVSILNNFSKKTKNRKMILMMDDIDQSLQKESFFTLLKSIKQEVPPDVMIITSSSSDDLQADHTIKLENFDEDEIRAFLTTNFGDLEEAVICEIIKKSQGYPASLGWLWRNYKRAEARDENMSSLLARFSQDGFIDQLQKNFLNDFLSNSEEEEIKALRICAHLVVADIYSVSSLTGIDILLVDKYLKKFEKSGITSKIANIPLPNGQIIDAYQTLQHFKMAIKTQFGTQYDTYIKAANYYADSLIKNRYSNSLGLVGAILEQYSYSRRGLNPAQLFEIIDSNPEDMLVLCVAVGNYYMVGRNIEKAKDFFNFIQSLSKHIESRNIAKAWNRFVEIIIPYAEAKYEDKRKIVNIAQEIESILSNETNAAQKSLLLSYTKMIKGIVSATESDDMDSAIEKMIEAAYTSMPLSKTNKKVSKIIVFTISGEGCLAAQNYDPAVFLLSDVVKELESLSHEDENEIERIFSLSSPESPYSLNDLKLKIGNELGMAYFYQITKMVSSDDFDEEEVMNNMRLCVNYLKSAQFDPFYGKLYAAAKEVLASYDSDSVQ
jgi:hypothetical protein